MNFDSKSICLLLLVWLSVLSAGAAEPAGAAPRESTNAKATAASAAKAKVKPKTKGKPQSTAGKPRATTGKPKATAAKPQANAKPQAKPVFRDRAEKPQPPEEKPQQKAEQGSRPASSTPPSGDDSPDGRKLDLEVAAARRAVAQDPGDIKARENLARLTVEIVDALLRAEAVGDSRRASELTQKLRTDLHDTGWRVQKMAEQGNLMAYQATGLLLERGLLLEMDANRSCADFFIAAEQLASAGWHAAKCLMKSSPDKAWVQMERAAVRGHATAQEWMGRRCVGEFGATDPDHACARFWLAQSASQGRPRSQTLLAYLLMNGYGGPVDEPRAARLYKLAAEQGDANAQNNLGEIHEMGRGVPPNPGEALRLYELAAEQGLSAAQFNAGRLWAIGTGDKKDPAKARSLLVQAEGNGVVQARQVLNWLDRQVPPGPVAVPEEPSAEVAGAAK
jgi:TPR repeat protein